ncbi:hypothetical protein RDABS01_014492 [Bienertia sinuspersici]
MKNKASSIMKNVISVLSSLVKGKVTVVKVVKSKADAIKVRLLVFSLMKGKKVSVASVSNKIQGLLEKRRNNKLKPEEDPSEEDVTDQNKAIVLYNSNVGSESHLNYANISDDLAPSEKRELLLEYYGHNHENYYNDEDNKYPDLTHSLFDEEVDNNHGGSVIDMVKNTKENEGQDFKLEDEIDHVADLFIKKFRRQMLLQKWDSFKRLQEMLGRST